MRKSSLLRYDLSSDIKSAFSLHAVFIVIYFMFVRFTACCMHTRTLVMRKEMRILTQLHSCLPVLVLNLERAPETTYANYLTIDKLCSPPTHCVDTLHMFFTIDMNRMVFARKGVLTARFCVIQANVKLKRKNVLATSIYQSTNAHII